MTKEASARPVRVPLNTRDRLKITNQDPGFVYRWVNDVEDRVASFEEAGYEIVDYRQHKAGSTRRLDVGQTGDNTVSMGGGTKAVLMRQRKEDYNQDQKAKQDHLDSLERTIKNPSLEGSYGEIKIS